MALSNKILNELKEIAPTVANIGYNNPYAVPMGYFENFSYSVMEAIQEKGIGETINPYSISIDYFDKLATNILAKINSIKAEGNNEVFEELENIAPLLNTISKKNVLYLPGNYFDNLNVNTTATKELKPAKVISIGNNARKWFTYAAAASVLFILSATSFLYVHHHMKNVDRSLTIGQRLATLDDKEILNYLQNDIDDFDPNTASSAEEDPDINHLLINATDEEIENYLDASSSDNVEEPVKGI
jgi:hypothetical protein